MFTTKTFIILATSVSFLTISPLAQADPDKDESGHGRGKREHKESHWDGNCKVERKWEKDGEYKEERKCKDGGSRGAVGAGHSSYFHQHGYTRIPNGHLPPPGECRIWYPDRPAGHQLEPHRSRGQMA